MAKLTEAYLRKLVKEAVSDLEGELYDYKEEEVEKGLEVYDDMFRAMEALDKYIEGLELDVKDAEEYGEINPINASELLSFLQSIVKDLESPFKYINDNFSNKAHRQRSMSSTALTTGFVPGNLNSPANDPQLAPNIDESRKRRMAPKRK